MESCGVDPELDVVLDDRITLTGFVLVWRLPWEKVRVLKYNRRQLEHNITTRYISYG